MGPGQPPADAADQPLVGGRPNRPPLLWGRSLLRRDDFMGPEVTGGGAGHADDAAGLPHPRLLAGAAAGGAAQAYGLPGSKGRPPSACWHSRVEQVVVHRELADLGLDVPVDARTVAGEHDVADGVLGEAERAGADLLVIGARKRSPVGKLLLGSATQRIVLNAEIPVLVVKTES